MGLKAMQRSKTGEHIPGLPVGLRKFILHYWPCHCSHFSLWSCPFLFPWQQRYSPLCNNSMLASHFLSLGLILHHLESPHSPKDGCFPLDHGLPTAGTVFLCREPGSCRGFSSNCAEEHLIRYSCHFLKGHLTCPNHCSFQDYFWSLILMAWHRWGLIPPCSSVPSAVSNP